MHPVFRAIALVTSLVVVLMGSLNKCGTDPELPDVGKISINPNPQTTSILINEEASLSIEASGSGELQYLWTASKGNLSSTEGSSVIYTAPMSPGRDNVSVAVSNKSGTTTRSIAFEVFEPATPTPQPTSTSEPTPISTPSKTPNPTPTDTPTVTPTPQQPLTELFPQVDAGEKFVYVNADGEITDRYVELDSCRHLGPYGLQLTYAMTGAGSGGWGIHWDKAPTQNFDASGFSVLSLWVKGSSGGETFQVGIKDTAGQEYKVESEALVIVSRSEWRQVRLDLNQIADEGVNLASLTNINLGFNRNHGAGTLCVDDIAFEK